MSPRPIDRALHRRGALLGAGLAALAAGCGSGVEQPVLYSHAQHVHELEIECVTCHDGAKTGVVAGLPPLDVCADCHRDPKGSSAEEAKVVAAVRANRPIPWVRLYALPRHVFFTHRRHVEVAGIACERCHGEMHARTRPPTEPLVALKMDDCLGCHREQGASTDCSACHR